MDRWLRTEQRRKDTKCRGNIIGATLRKPVFRNRCRVDDVEVPINKKHIILAEITVDNAIIVHDGQRFEQLTTEVSLLGGWKLVNCLKLGEILKNDDPEVFVLKGIDRSGGVEPEFADTTGRRQLVLGHIERIIEPLKEARRPTGYRPQITRSGEDGVNPGVLRRDDLDKPASVDDQRDRKPVVRLNELNPNRPPIQPVGKSVAYRFKAIPPKGASGDLSQLHISMLEPARKQASGCRFHDSAQARETVT